MLRGLPAAVVRRTDATQRYGLRLTLFAVAIVLLVVPFSYLLFQVLAEGWLTRVDGDVARRLNDLVHDHPAWIATLEAISWMGKPPVLWVVTGIAVVFTWRHGTHRLTLFLVATTLGGAVVSTALKVLIDRPRPEVANPIATAFGKSFPSGHALSSTVVYGAVLLTFLPVLPRRARTPAIVATVLLVLGIGLTRLFLGVHFISDVLGGFLLGIVWLCCATAAFEIWRVERGRRPSHPLTEGVEPEAVEALTTSPS